MEVKIQNMQLEKLLKEEDLEKVQLEIKLREQAITVIEALKMYTIWGAKAMREEQLKGLIEPGKFADMVVLSADVLNTPPEQLINLKALKTIVAGNIVYEAK